MQTRLGLLPMLSVRVVLLSRFREEMRVESDLACVRVRSRQKLLDPNC